MSIRSNSTATRKALMIETLMTVEVYAMALKKRVETGGTMEDEREIASRTRAEALDLEIAAFERCTELKL
jgi:hypothetical protein